MPGIEGGEGEVAVKVLGARPDCSSGPAITPMANKEPEHDC